jgi:hypothetical protein
MTSSSRPRAARRARFVVSALSLSAFMCTAVALPLPPAGAVDVSGRRGDAGHAALSPAWMDAFSIANQRFRVLGGGRGFVLESPRYSHRAQSICLTTFFKQLHVVARGADTWEQVHQNTQCRRVAASEVGAGFSDEVFQGAQPFARYRAAVRIRWRLVRDGPVVGTAWFRYDRRRDYRCPTANPDFGCRVGYRNEVDSAYITSTFRG